ncbi:MAG: ATP synthase F1 subunit gamma [Bacteroidetes bacterium]|nr:ATP synthase F1 subunit gamma [Bacteroidota bacterium]
MATLRDIRSRISSVKNTQQVTRAMKMVAAAKLRKAQERIFQTRPYATEIGEIISHVKGKSDPTSHPLFLEREERLGVLLIVITGDRGLAGAFNGNIIRLTEQTIERECARQQAAGHLYLAGVGRKGYDYFAKRGYQMAGDFRGIFRDLGFGTAQKIGELAIDGFVEGRWDEVKLIYNEFKNTIAQNRIVEPFLPIPAEHFLTPVMEMFVEHQAEVQEGRIVDYIFEPDARTILDVLVPRYLNYQLWRALLESNAAEQGARMVAMYNATSNASELGDDLTLSLNKLRQSGITKELLEITTGAEALQN